MSQSKAYRIGYVAMRQFAMRKSQLLAEYERLSQLFGFAVAESYLQGVYAGARELGLVDRK